MKRKISMFAVTLCLTAAMLTGCGGNKNGTTTSPMNPAPCPEPSPCLLWDWKENSGHRS